MASVTALRKTLQNSLHSNSTSQHITSISEAMVVRNKDKTFACIIFLLHLLRAVS